MIYWCNDGHIERPFLSHHFVDFLHPDSAPHSPGHHRILRRALWPVESRSKMSSSEVSISRHCTDVMTMEAHHKKNMKNHECMWYSTASNVAKKTSNNLISSGYCIVSSVPTWWNVETCFSRVVREWRDHPLVAIGSWCSDLSTLFHHTTLFSKYFSIAAWHFQYNKVAVRRKAANPR